MTRHPSQLPVDTGERGGNAAPRETLLQAASPEGDWLDQALRDLAGAPPADAGFTARVMARLEGQGVAQAALARLAARRAQERVQSRFGWGGAAMGLGVSLAWLLSGMPAGGGLPAATALGLTAGLTLCAGAMAWTVR